MYAFIGISVIMAIFIFIIMHNYDTSLNREMHHIPVNKVEYLRFYNQQKTKYLSKFVSHTAFEPYTDYQQAHALAYKSQPPHSDDWEALVLAELYYQHDIINEQKLYSTLREFLGCYVTRHIKEEFCKKFLLVAGQDGKVIYKLNENVFSYMITPFQHFKEDL